MRVYNKLIANNCALFSGVIPFNPCRSKACFLQYTQKLPIMWWWHFLPYQCAFSSSISPSLAGLGPGVLATCLVAHATVSYTHLTNRWGGWNQLLWTLISFRKLFWGNLQEDWDGFLSYCRAVIFPILYNLQRASEASGRKYPAVCLTSAMLPTPFLFTFVWGAFSIRFHFKTKQRISVTVFKCWKQRFSKAPIGK